MARKDKMRRDKNRVDESNTDRRNDFPAVYSGDLNNPRSPIKKRAIFIDSSLNIP